MSAQIALTFRNTLRKSLLSAASRRGQVRRSMHGTCLNTMPTPVGSVIVTHSAALLWIPKTKLVHLEAEAEACVEGILSCPILNKVHREHGLVVKRTDFRHQVPSSIV